MPPRSRLDRAARRPATRPPPPRPAVPSPPRTTSRPRSSPWLRGLGDGERGRARVGRFEVAQQHLEQARRGGERTLDPRTLDPRTPDARWDIIEHRPYLRALMNLALPRRRQGRYPDALPPVPPGCQRTVSVRAVP